MGFPCVSAHMGLAFTCDGKELCPHACNQPLLLVTAVEESPSAPTRQEELRQTLNSELRQRNSYIHLYSIKTSVVCVCYSVSVFNASNLTVECSINVRTWSAYLGTKTILIYLCFKLKAKEVDADF